MHLIEEGKVIHAGTMNSSNPTVAAALTTIEILEEEDPYDRIFYLGQKLMKGLQNAANETGQNLLVQGLGPMFHAGFTTLSAVSNYRDTLSYDKGKGSKFIAGMHNRGVRIIGRGLWYISAAHTEEDIDHAVQTAEAVLQNM